MRHEVDSNFFELLTLYPPPPSRCSGGTHPPNVRGVKRGLKILPMAYRHVVG